jgi:glycosyltransferase involved in cell wall biosynthesis
VPAGEQNPVVSVVVPGRDAAPYVADALASLSRQVSDPNALEVIFINDGSQDATGDLVAGHQSSLPGLRLLTNPVSLGVSAARNLGLSQARGRYVGFLDADDWFAPGYLQTLVDQLDRLGCDFVRTDVVLAHGTQRTVVRAPHGRRGTVLAARDGVLPVTSKAMVDHPSMFAGLFHRRLVDRGLLSFDESLPSAEDRELMWRLHLQADTFAVVDAPGAFYRRGLNGSLTQATDQRRLGYLDAFERVRRNLISQSEAEALLGKAVQTVLALTGQHLARGPARGESRVRLVSGAAELLRRYPHHVVRSAVHRLDRDRRRQLAAVLRLGRWR